MSWRNHETNEPLGFFLFPAIAMHFNPQYLDAADAPVKALVLDADTAFQTIDGFGVNP